jgi:hypothetical protein
LPRVHEDALVEIGIDKRHVRVAFLEVLLVHSGGERGSLHMRGFVVEILVRRLREALNLTVAVEGDLRVKLPGVHMLSFVIESSGLQRLLSEDLRLGAEVLLFVLWEILDGPILFVQSAQILIIVRVVVVVEGIHPLVRLVHFGIATMRDQVEAALVEYLANLLWVKALQLVEINCLQQVELLFRQLSKVILT